MKKEKLDLILEKHQKWLMDMEDGSCANLYCANLSGANLSGANLSRANLSGADLYGANLSGANLSRADLYGANLSGANLSRADLSGANLSGANLSRADLYGANLSGANLYGANLYGANLSGANLYGANLSRASLYDAKIENDTLDKYFPICCPEYGSFIGWKKAHNKIVKLQIAEDAKRCSAFSRKCRCSKAYVLSIENIDGANSGLSEVASDRDKAFIYRVGEMVEVQNFDDDRKNECSTGIHFFITRNEAVDYN